MLTIETFWVCIERETVSVKVEGSKGNSYRVEWSKYRGNRGPGWECSCFGYKFRGTCKHIEKVEKQYNCNWHQQFESGEPIDGKCPRCNGEVQAVRCGV
jgi:uncharacterized Zn finger protein